MQAKLLLMVMRVEIIGRCGPGDGPGSGVGAGDLHHALGGPATARAPGIKRLVRIVQRAPQHRHVDAGHQLDPHPSARRCATLHGVAPNTSVKISTRYGPAATALVERGPALGLDRLRRERGVDVHRLQQRRSLGKGMASGRLDAEASGAWAMISSPAIAFEYIHARRIDSPAASGRRRNLDRTAAGAWPSAAALEDPRAMANTTDTSLAAAPTGRPPSTANRGEAGCGVALRGQMAGWRPRDHRGCAVPPRS